MPNLHSKDVIENRKWAMQVSAAICRNVPLEAVLATAEEIYVWAAVVPPRKKQETLRG